MMLSGLSVGEPGTVNEPANAFSEGSESSFGGKYGVASCTGPPSTWSSTYVKVAGGSGTAGFVTLVTSICEQLEISRGGTERKSLSSACAALPVCVNT